MTKPLRILFLGAGVQSGTLLLMAVHGELHIDKAVRRTVGLVQPSATECALEELERLKKESHG